MEVKAIAKGVRVQPRKVRIVADEVRGKSAMQVVGLLRYHPSKGARELRKVLMSAIANAQENNNLSPESLRIATIMVDEGPRLKRIRARAMGRANRIVKKSSHITVVVEDFEGQAPVKPHGTKAKPRPTFAAPSKGKKKKTEEAPKAAAPAPETTDTVAEEAAVAEVIETAEPQDETAISEAQPEEATPVTEAEAPEEAGSAEPVAEQEETTEQAEGEAEKEKGAE
jgi:large subunit ribosomal protein L22